VPKVTVNKTSITKLNARQFVQTSEDTDRIPVGIETEVTEEQLKVLNNMKGVTVKTTSESNPPAPRGQSGGNQ
jgi:hypothetical protein